MTNLWRNSKVRYEVSGRIPIPVGDTGVLEVFAYEVNDPTARLDLTGSTVECKVVDDLLDSDVSATLDTNSGVEIIDAELGHLEVTFGPAVTDLLGVYGGLLHYEVKVTTPSSAIYTVAKGRLRLVPDTDSH